LLVPLVAAATQGDLKAAAKAKGQEYKAPKRGNLKFIRSWSATTLLACGQLPA
jgi:hypothetical protein